MRSPLWTHLALWNPYVQAWPDPAPRSGSADLNEAPSVVRCDHGQGVPAVNG